MKHVFRFIVGIIILLLIFSYFYNKKQLSNEFVEARKAEYVDRYTTGEYMLNIYRTGNKESNYKIIGISDFAENDFSVKSYFINEDLKDLYDLIYIDRAGYGISEDTLSIQSVENIVDDYRNALNRADIKGPYVLMAHGYGSVYATYWENKYPNEVSGVIYLDGTTLSEENKAVSIDYKEYFKLIMNKLGLNRYFGETETVSVYYSPELVNFSKTMNLRSSSTNARISEVNYMKTSMDETYNLIKENNIPKMYVTSSVFKSSEEYRDYFDWYNKRLDSQDKSIQEVPTDSQISKIVNDSKMYEIENVIPFTDLLGNTKIFEVVGPEKLFEENHSDLSGLIKEFINSL